jgi:hypothetical protein
MFYLKVAMIYAILYSVTTFLVLMTSSRNPAVAFFLPSIGAMMVYARIRFQNKKANVMKHAMACGLVFGIVATLLSWVIQLNFNWIARPEIMYAVCFGGNFLFPMMLFPQASRAQNG